MVSQYPEDPVCVSGTGIWESSAGYEKKSGRGACVGIKGVALRQSGAFFGIQVAVD